MLAPMSLLPSASPLTAEHILAAAEEMVRRHGPDKATVVDVAQALGVSHGNIYRFFPTKAALREAVVELWLGRTVAAQAALSPDGTALERLRAWFWAFFALKQAQRAADPQLFEAFRQLSSETRSTVVAYKEQLIGQIAGHIARGIASGELVPGDPVETAQALLSALIKFHHPAFAAGWDEPARTAELEPLWALLARGISRERSPQ